MSAKIETTKFEVSTRHLKLLGHIGFDSLPEQLVSKSVKNGFIFNILCIGETGIGKSTLMNSLFNTDFESIPSPHNLEGVKLKSNTYELQEGNVKLKLAIVDTIGYGDQIDKNDSCKDIVDYIDAQFETYLQEELKIKREINTYLDTRVHVCLYFICPTGHGLKAIDLACMKNIDKKVNIIPIIAKADSISKLELQNFKAKVIKELEIFDIDFYKFPTDDESIANFNSQMNAHVPFAVVGSTDFIRVGNKVMRCREYPWGIVEVENEAHNDFVKLREMLIRTNMEDMRDKTHHHFYEIYRQKRLQELGISDIDNKNENMNFKRSCEIKKAAFLKELQEKEDEMRKVFITRVKDAETELKNSEKELHDKFELLNKDYVNDKNKLDEKFKQLEKDIQEFNKIKVQVASQYTSYCSLTLGRSKKK